MGRHEGKQAHNQSALASTLRGAIWMSCACALLRKKRMRPEKARHAQVAVLKARKDVGEWRLGSGIA